MNIKPILQLENIIRDITAYKLFLVCIYIFLNFWLAFYYFNFVLFLRFQNTVPWHANAQPFLCHWGLRWPYYKWRGASEKWVKRKRLDFCWKSRISRGRLWEISLLINYIPNLKFKDWTTWNITWKICRGLDRGWFLGGGLYNHRVTYWHKKMLTDFKVIHRWRFGSINISYHQAYHLCSDLYLWFALRRGT